MHPHQCHCLHEEWAAPVLLQRATAENGQCVQKLCVSTTAANELGDRPRG